MTLPLVTDYPRSVVEAHAALGFGTFSHGWLCDELSGDLLPAFGGLTLTAGGTGTVYGADGPGGASDKAVGFGGNRSGQFAGGQEFDVAGTDDLVVAWVGLWTVLPTLFGAIVGKATATFTNGWSITGKDGTGMSMAAGASGVQTSTIAGSSAYHVGNWHVGIGVVDRSAGRLRFGTRSLAGVETIGPQSGSFGSTSFSSAATFTIGNGAWVPANDGFRLSAIFIGKSVGAASGMLSNLSPALRSFARYVTRTDSYKAKLLRRMLPPPYKQDFGAVVPSVLGAIGQSDNLIGGLFGADDFLPDEG